MVQYESEVTKSDKVLRETRTKVAKVIDRLCVFFLFSKDAFTKFGVRLVSVSELRQFGTQKIADCAKYGNTARLSCVPTASTSAYIISVKGFEKG